jgi:hypothetical protein
MNSHVPQCAALTTTYVEATRPKERKALLEFGRDSSWPRKVTVASALDEINSMSVTYSISWEGCDGSTEWLLSKFDEAAQAGQLTPLSVFARQGLTWTAVLRKENNSFRAVLHEKRVDGIIVCIPEEEEIPLYLFHGPRAEIKMRCLNLPVVEQYLQTLYNGQVVCTARLLGTEWATIGALGDGISSGEIPAKHRVIRDDSVKIQAEAWNQRIRDAGLKTQNYDKGFERFVRKFYPDQEMESTIAIVKGAHHEHGTAVSISQHGRRCLLLDTLYGLSDEEALWYTLMTWAKFQPRLKRPRQEPGQFFYLVELSHVFDMYGDYLNKPEAHPEACQELPFIQDCMTHYSASLSELDL